MHIYEYTIRCTSDVRFAAEGKFCAGSKFSAIQKILDMIFKKMYELGINESELPKDLEYNVWNDG